MWAINNYCAVNMDKVEYFYINQVNNLADNSYEIVTDTDLSIIGCLTKEEAEHVFNAITYAIDIGYSKVDVARAVADYREAQRRKELMA